MTNRGFTFIELGGGIALLGLLTFTVIRYSTIMGKLLPRLTEIQAKISVHNATLNGLDCYMTFADPVTSSVLDPKTGQCPNGTNIVLRDEKGIQIADASGKIAGYQAFATCVAGKGVTLTADSRPLFGSDIYFCREYAMGVPPLKKITKAVNI